MATKAATHGFWRGFLSGLVLAAAGLLALAWFYPPGRSTPPEAGAGAVEAPGAAGGTEDAAGPSAPRP
jgi:hypothetical protein